MNLFIWTNTFYKVKRRYGICLKFEAKLSPSRTKSVTEVKARICSTLKENLIFMLM